MEETISLIEIVEILRKRLLMIIILTVIGGGAAFGVSRYYLTPMYSAEAEMIVLPRQDENTSQNFHSDVNGNLLMLNTYKDMIKGRRVLGEVSELLQEAGLKYETSQLQGMVSVVHSQNSQVFQINVTSAKAGDAAVIANQTANVFKKEAHEMLDVSKVNISSEAVTPKAPFSPNTKLNLLIGLAIGVMAGIGLAFLLTLLDGTIQSEESLSDLAGLPVIGEISRIQVSKQPRKAITTITPLPDGTGGEVS